ncbi:cystathionine gamma-lyase [Defluviimonas sp. WL0050]|uniref:Cystathionine gamma-lyase n=1 Tax=Albidovulum litorale TaxID=2984134 RepID=A0ABT2ZN31_9RHOB|nr:cystathionine gamma-lyase [Defluviimonas sp. WL0050]MCV2872433.1 cystathionine gamma-lyase [Defluviimonas sp. WL0050]
MTHDDAQRAAGLLHLHRETLSKGDPVPPQITLAAMYHLPGDPACVRTYGRADNPNWEVLEQALAHLESADTVVFPSGMSAIAAPLFSLLGSGDRLLIPSDGYYTTRLLADRFLKRLGVTVETRPTVRMEDGGFDGYRLVFLETPSNPGLDLCDLADITAAVRATGGLTVVDNTTMTPFGQRPLDLGADIVVAADTKAPNGHSDVLMGHVASRDGEIIAAVREWRKLSGSIPGPFECWLAHRGLETLELRFDRMCSSAATLAPRLAEHPAIRAIRYPGLDSDPSHGLAQRQMTRPGFLIGLTLLSAEAAEAFINACPLLQPATSFGGVHSSAERRIRWGDAVDPGFVRLSVGCEPVEELWKALKTSLDACV